MKRRTRKASNGEPEAAVLRVVVLQASRLYRDCFTETLGKHPAFDPIAQVSDEAAALTVVPDLDPDVLLIDGADEDAPDLIRSMARVIPRAKIIACGVPNEDPVVLACAEAGVSGFVSAETPLEELGESILAACRGELRSPGIASVLLRAVAARGTNGSRSERQDHDLTEREGDVVELIEQGFSNKEIAAELALGVSTVKHHVHSILNKLKVRRRSQVAACRRDTSTLSVDQKI